MRFGRSDGHFRRLELGPRQQALVEQGLRPFELLLRVGEGHSQAIEIRVGPDDVGALLLDVRLEQRRVEPRDHLPLLHDRVEVGVEILNDAADLRAHLDGRHGLERAGRGHDVDDVAAGDWRRAHLGLRGCAAHVVRADANADRYEHDDNRQKFLLHVSLSVLCSSRRYRDGSLVADL